MSYYLRVSKNEKMREIEKVGRGEGLRVKELVFGYSVKEDTSISHIKGLFTSNSPLPLPSPQSEPWSEM